MKKNHHRPDLIGEHKAGDAGQLILFVVFMGVWMADSLWLHKTTLLNDHVPLFVRIPLAALALTLSLILVFGSMRRIFGEQREKPEIVRRGVYRVIRHPMYVSEILLYLSLIFLNLSLAAMIVLIPGILFLYAICRYEEKLLLNYFGETYREYMKETPMWIPRIQKKGKK
ncbi:MAG: isoprenylcysteine carboxylmethyltransferase family protein [Candidatus Marinimicrobia bacterium]|nr:isoprenylcysteine carboxylmethyltransferase family protein [Candidatus Neomarinimicrobiota bacterium]